MTNPTVNALIPIQSSINALKEPFCKAQDPATITVASALLSPFNPSGISDKDLLRLCQEYGGNSRVWKRKFEELLPEVLKRHLYKGRKFTSIYEFAAKLCGLSHDSVDNVIRVYGQLEDKPILRSLVVEFGWSKLRIVAGIATPETDASWAEKVRVLPKDSLEVFVRDLKRQEEKERIEKGQADGQEVMGLNRQSSGREAAGSNCRSENRLNTGAPGQGENTITTCLLSTEQGKLTDQQSLLRHQSLTCPIFPRENLQFIENHGQTDMCLPAQFGHPNLITATGEHYENSWSTMSFKVDPEVEFRLRKLKVRIEKGKKEKISFNQLFEVILNVIENKERIAKKQKNPYGMAPLKLCRV